MESKLLVEERKIVVPGETLAKGIDYLPGFGTYKENGEIRSKILGLVKLKDHIVSVVPLSGVYIPMKGDGVIGIVSDVQIASWIVDINSPYMGFLPLSEATNEFVDLTKFDITEYFDVGDVVYLKVNKVTKRKDVQLTVKDRMCRKLYGGNIIRITPAKVPRLIGRGGSMIEMIKKKTGCHIIVGQNGLVWIKGDKETLAAKAVLMVERESHTEGLTDRISEMLDREAKKEGGKDE
ncbi:MAG TPA: S1 RNA-binding domain-containing protein [Candidatus Aenigmarchaeota archaeon]|nr:S1 RNA-binding domain-containing protein [Candidatus Aenigmarchaeota archaeon]